MDSRCVVDVFGYCGKGKGSCSKSPNTCGNYITWGQEIAGKSAPPPAESKTETGGEKQK